MGTSPENSLTNFDLDLLLGPASTSLSVVQGLDYQTHDGGKNGSTNDGYQTQNMGKNAFSGYNQYQTQNVGNNESESPFLSYGTTNHMFKIPDMGNIRTTEQNFQDKNVGNSENMGYGHHTQNIRNELVYSGQLNNDISSISNYAVIASPDFIFLKNAFESQTTDYEALKKQYAKLASDYAKLHKENKEHAMESLKYSTIAENIEQKEVGYLATVHALNEQIEKKTVDELALRKQLMQYQSHVEDLDAQIAQMNHAKKNMKPEKVDGKDKTISTQNSKIQSQERQLSLFASALANSSIKVDKECRRLINKYCKKVLSTSRKSEDTESFENQSVDTGRGSSLAFSDGDRSCSNSPAYSFPFSPISIGVTTPRNEHTKMTRDSFTSPPPMIKTFDISTSPIVFEEVVTSTPAIKTTDVGTNTSVLTKTVHIATSPIKFRDMDTPVTKAKTLDTATSPVMFADMITPGTKTFNFATSPIQFGNTPTKTKMLDAAVSPVMFTDTSPEVTKTENMNDLMILVSKTKTLNLVGNPGLDHTDVRIPATKTLATSSKTKDMDSSMISVDVSPVVVSEMLNLTSSIEQVDVRIPMPRTSMLDITRPIECTSTKNLVKPNSLQVANIPDTKTLKLKASVSSNCNTSHTEYCVEKLNEIVLNQPNHSQDDIENDLEIKMILSNNKLDWNMLSPMSLTPEADRDHERIQTDSNEENKQSHPFNNHSTHTSPIQELVSEPPDTQISNKYHDKLNKTNIPDICEGKNKRQCVKKPRSHTICPIKYSTTALSSIKEKKSQFSELVANKILDKKQNVGIEARQGSAKASSRELSQEKEMQVGKLLHPLTKLLDTVCPTKRVCTPTQIKSNKIIVTSHIRRDSSAEFEAKKKYFVTETQSSSANMISQADKSDTNEKVCVTSNSSSNCKIEHPIGKLSQSLTLPIELVTETNYSYPNPTIKRISRVKKDISIVSPTNQIENNQRCATDTIKRPRKKSGDDQVISETCDVKKKKTLSIPQQNTTKEKGNMDRSENTKNSVIDNTNYSERHEDCSYKIKDYQQHDKSFAQVGTPSQDNCNINSVIVTKSLNRRKRRSDHFRTDSFDTEHINYTEISANCFKNNKRDLELFEQSHTYTQKGTPSQDESNIDSVILAISQNGRDRPPDYSDINMFDSQNVCESMEISEITNTSIISNRNDLESYQKRSTYTQKGSPSHDDSNIDPVTLAKSQNGRERPADYSDINMFDTLDVCKSMETCKITDIAVSNNRNYLEVYQQSNTYTQEGGPRQDESIINSKVLVKPLNGPVRSPDYSDINMFDSQNVCKSMNTSEITNTSVISNRNYSKCYQQSNTHTQKGTKSQDDNNIDSIFLTKSSKKPQFSDIGINMFPIRNNKENNEILWKDNVLDRMIYKYLSRPGMQKVPKGDEELAMKIKSAIEKCVSMMTKPNEPLTSVKQFVHELKPYNTKRKVFGFMTYLNDPARLSDFVTAIGVKKGFVRPSASKFEVALIEGLHTMKECGTDIWDPIMNMLEFILFKLDNTASPCFAVVESVAHLYATICKYRNNPRRLWLFMLNAMYFFSFKAIPLIKHCLDMVPEVIPNSRADIETARLPLIRCFVFLLNYNNCIDRFNRLDEIRRRLKYHYHYNLQNENETTLLVLLKTAVMQLTDRENDKFILELSFLITAKRRGTKWTHNNIVRKILLPMISGEVEVFLIAKRFCITTLGCLLKPYNNEMIVHTEEVVNKLVDLFKEPTQIDEIKDDIVRSLISMDIPTLWEVINECLLSWNPPSLSQELENALKVYVNRKPWPAWKNIHDTKFNQGIC